MFKKIIMAVLVMMTLLAKADAATSDEVIANLKANLPSNGQHERNIIVYTEVPFAEMKGFYLVSIDGHDMVVHESGKFAVLGDLYGFRGSVNVNLSQEMKTIRMREVARTEISKIPEDDFLIYPSKTGETIGILYVLTDPRCDFCKIFHGDIQQYQNAGVEIKYIPYPLKGMVDGDKNYELTKQAFCAKKPAEAFTDIVAGKTITEYKQESYQQNCLDNIKAGRVLGEKLGISGLPFLYFSTGEVNPGYLPPNVVIDEFRK